ncbi:CoA-binding protein [Janthinobacterium agaricidamnosum]|nr:CoA-binding protein [Janthinobacterium agaricidamnosum]
MSTIAHRTIVDLLAASRIIAVAGHQVAAYLLAHGYRILPVNPSYAGRDILGQRCYATLAAAGLDVVMDHCLKIEHARLEAA